MANTKSWTGKRKRRLSSPTRENKRSGKKVAFEAESQIRPGLESNDFVLDYQVNDLASLHNELKAIRQENQKLREEMRELRQKMIDINFKQTRIELGSETSEELLEHKVKGWMLADRTDLKEFMIREIQRHLAGMAEIMVTGSDRSRF